MGSRAAAGEGLVYTLAGVLLLVVVGGWVIVAGRGGVAVGDVAAVIPLTAAPGAGLSVASSGVWVPSDANGALARLDAQTNQVSAVIHLGPTPTCTLCWGAVAAHEGAVWTTSTSARLAVVAIDPLENRIITSLPMSVFPSAVASANDGTLWLASVLDSAVVRIDPKTQRQLASISVPRAARLAVGGGAVWVLSHGDAATSGTVAKIDPFTNHVVATIEVGLQPIAIAFGDDSVWVVDASSQRLQRIDPQSNTVVAQVGVGFLPTGVAAGSGSVWVISHSAPGVSGPALARIDPSSNTVSGSVALGEGSPVGVAFGAGSVWVASRDPNAIVRVTPLPLPSTRSWIDSQPLLLVVAALLLLLMAWFRRSSLHRRTYAPVHYGAHMSDLRRFAQNRARGW
jgi:YVTN family beta-propeller protein